MPAQGFMEFADGGGMGACGVRLVLEEKPPPALDFFLFLFFLPPEDDG